MSINQFIIDGNLTKDVELRYTGGGTPTTTYTVAVSEIWYDNENKKHERKDYIAVTTYGRQAESDAKYLKKGSGVTAMGRIQSWYKRGENGQEGRGGYNFEASRVIYRGEASEQGGRNRGAGQQGGEEGRDGGGTDEWVQDYDRAKQGKS